jgi:ABC-type nitrate/sulfonate/bicarbonate transport system permease component
VNGADRLFRVTLPAALPSVATGIRISAAIALVVCVTAEFRTGAGGVGYYMDSQQNANNIPEMYAAAVLVALLGYGMNIVLRAVQRRTLFWAGEERSAH